MQAAVVIIFVYAFVMLSDWTKGCLKTRGYVTLSSLLTIGLAVLSSFGLCSWAGLFYSPLMSGALPPKLPDHFSRQSHVHVFNRTQSLPPLMYRPTAPWKCPVFGGRT